MITIQTIRNHTLDYNCSCGAEGVCMFKPSSGNSLMLLEIKCPMCGILERVKIMKYDSENTKEQLLEEDVELHWALVLDNRLKEE